MYSSHSSKIVDPMSSGSDNTAIISPRSSSGGMVPSSGEEVSPLGPLSVLPLFVAFRS